VWGLERNRPGTVLLVLCPACHDTARTAGRLVRACLSTYACVWLLYVQHVRARRTAGRLLCVTQVAEVCRHWECRGTCV
jgi:hypothetical protein